jgi:serine/threonine protein kinase
VKLADFGFAKAVDKRNSCRTLCGTPGYLAPEVLERWPAYEVVCDMWGFGVILFLLLGGYLPFDPTASKDTNAVFERTRNGEYHFYPQRWQNISQMAKDLVARCLNINPNKRMTAKQALQHPWMQSGEAALSIAQIDTANLKSVVQDRQRLKRNEKQRVEDLNDDFTVYLDKRKADSIVSHMTGAHKTIATAATAFNEEGNSGRPVGTFYKKGEILGEGAFATVYRCRHNRTGMSYAIKEIDLSGLTAKELKTLKVEISVLKFVRGGPAIIRLFDVFREPQKYHLVLEEMKGGDLLSRILEKEVYTENEARDCCRHFFEAVKYCHRKRIAHRDIKLDNLLLVVSEKKATSDPNHANASLTFS